MHLVQSTLEYYLQSFVDDIDFMAEIQDAAEGDDSGVTALLFLSLLAASYILDNAEAFRILSAEVMFAQSCSKPLILSGENPIAHVLPLNTFSKLN